MKNRYDLNANGLVNELKDANEKNAHISVDGKVGDTMFTNKDATWATGIITSRHSRHAREKVPVEHNFNILGDTEKHTYILKSEEPPYELTVRITLEPEKYYSGVTGFVRLIRDVGKAILLIRKEDS